MNTTEATPTHSILRVTQNAPTVITQFAHYTHRDIPIPSPPVALRVEHSSGPYDRIHLPPHPFLSSHHAPQKSISKPEISSSRLPNALANYSN